MLEFEPVMGFFCKIVEHGHRMDVHELSPLAVFDVSKWASKVIQFQRDAVVPCVDEDG